MTPNPSTSSFSLALDPINEASGAGRPSYPNTPILGSPSIEPASPTRFYAHPLPSASSTTSLSRTRELGLGHPAALRQISGHYLQPPHSASTPQHRYNSEIILYSYAQLTGSVVLTPQLALDSLNVPSSSSAGLPTALNQAQVNEMRRVREALLGAKRSVVGGGSMDINSSLLNRSPSGETSYGASPGSASAKAHGRSTSLSGALWGMLSPTAGSDSPQPDSVPQTPELYQQARASQSGLGLGLGLSGVPSASVSAGHLPESNMSSSTFATSRSHRRNSGSISASANGYSSSNTHSRRSSIAGWILGGGSEYPQSTSSSSGLGGSLGGGGSGVVSEEMPLPTFEVQPAMLGVDLVLGPGEERSYTYTVNLPDNLPPTFRGKAMRFSYELVVGLCRSSPSGPFTPSTNGNAGTVNVSKLMKVPIRVYNNVVVDRHPKPYNLLWPVDKRMDLAMPRMQAKVEELEVGGGPLPSSSSQGSHGGASSKEVIGSTAATRAKGKGKDKGGLQDLVRYTKRLLDALPPPESAHESPPPSIIEDAVNVPLPSSRAPSHSPPPPDSGSDSEPREAVDVPLPASPTASPSPLPLPFIQEQSPSSTPSNQSAQDQGRRQDEGPKELQQENGTPPHENGHANAPHATPPPIASTVSPASTSQSKPAPQNTPPRPRARRPTNLDLDFDRTEARPEDDRDGVLLGGGCREAVEILTRTQKKASYDVNKDGVKVAVLTFPKSSYRLGETISGVVELNERRGRARVVQLSAFLEAHESMPNSLLPPTANRFLKRRYAEHFSSSLLNTLRTTFSLDIPSDASPAFQTCVGTPRTMANAPGGATTFGGIEWKVRLCLLVAIASPDADTGTEGVIFKNLVRDGPRGEWGSGWKGLEVSCPLEKPKPPKVVKRKPRPGSLFLNSSEDFSVTSPGGSARSTSWTAFFASYLSPSGATEREYHDGDELVEDDDSGYGDSGSIMSPYRRSSSTGKRSSGFLGSFIGSYANDSEDDYIGSHNADPGYDGIKPDLAGGVGKGVDFGNGEDGWRHVKLEMVECEVPVRVWPGNTAFRTMDVVFEV
ncbi:hypothetical protein MD484_g4759, partial [Candolleomyces efflorescens]